MEMGWVETTNDVRAVASMCTPCLESPFAPQNFGSIARALNVPCGLFFSHSVQSKNETTDTSMGILGPAQICHCAVFRRSSVYFIAKLDAKNLFLLGMDKHKIEEPKTSTVHATSPCLFRDSARGDWDF